MKVLYISGMYPNPKYPQKGIFCHEQVKALKKLGIDVDVVVPVTLYDKEVDRDTWVYEGVEIRYARFFKLPGTRDFHRTGQNLYRSLNRVVDLQQYSIYHADAPLPAGQAAMIASEKHGKPFVVHGHGLDVFLEESYQESRNLRRIVNASVEVYEKADAVCGVSKKVLDKIGVKVNLGDRGFVVYNGADAEVFRPDESKKENYVFTAGNLIALKGHDDTIRAFAEYVSHGDDGLVLKIAGRGVLEEELRKLATELDVQDRVEFIGYVPYGQMVELMQGAKLFCMPSWYEALGCVYLEAMACGIPAIGCRGNGIDEVIDNGRNGFLVDAHAPEQICQVISRVMRSDSNPWGVQARWDICNKYTWNHSARHLMSVYEAIA